MVALLGEGPAGRRGRRLARGSPRPGAQGRGLSLSPPRTPSRMVPRASARKRLPPAREASLVPGVDRKVTGKPGSWPVGMLAQKSQGPSSSYSLPEAWPAFPAVSQGGLPVMSWASRRKVILRVTVGGRACLVLRAVTQCGAPG